MSTTKPDFLAIEIDGLDASLDASLDVRLAETARRKRIPSLKLDVPLPPDAPDPGEELGGDSPKPSRKTQPASSGPAEGLAGRPAQGSPVEILGHEPAHRPGSAGEPRAARQAARRRPLSLEVPDYLARELKVKAATEGVTVRYLVLNALLAAGYRVDTDELEEDGRRLR